MFQPNEITAMADVPLQHVSNHDRAACRRRSCLHARRGLTLIELTMSMAITALMSVVLLGLISAVHTAREHTEGLESATLQSQAGLERIKFMVSQVGTYKLDGQPTRAGLAVIKRSWLGYEMPDTLVVWSGGRDGGQSLLGKLDRLPNGNELVVYAADLKRSERLVEYAFPDWTTPVDFDAPDFDATILDRLAFKSTEKARLCDRMRISSLDRRSTAAWPNVRFSHVLTPSSIELTETDPASAEWKTLPWSQGIVTSTGGLRHEAIRIELQMEPRAYSSNDSTKPIAIPFFASASTRYVYEP